MLSSKEETMDIYVQLIEAVPRASNEAMALKRPAINACALANYTITSSYNPTFSYIQILIFDSNLKYSPSNKLFDAQHAFRPIRRLAVNAEVL